MERQVLSKTAKWMVKGLKKDQVFEISHWQDYYAVRDPKLGPFVVPEMPMDIHPLLVGMGVIENPCIHGNSEEIQWISDCGWVYQTAFSKGAGEFSHASLTLKGIDTYADVYLNGELLGSTEDVYLPYTFPVEKYLQEENVLLIHVKPPLPILDQVTVSEDWADLIGPATKGRVLYSAYGDYLGPKPCLIHMGLYDDVILEQWNSRLTEVDVTSTVDLEQDAAKIEVRPQWDGGTKVEVVILSPKEEVVFSQSVLPGEKAEAILTSPEYWWPTGMGEQPLYTVRAMLYDGERETDRQEKKIGIRKLELAGDFDFRINGQPLKLWGGCLAPFNTLSGCYDVERMKGIMELAELAHFNCFRLWGEDGVIPDVFYETCDEKGLLVWQDFFTGNAVYDNNPHLEDLMKQEAIHQVKRLKHHPCILLWCGGNESLMKRDFEFPEKEYPNRKIFLEIFAEVCKEYDPERYYHPTSPYGGAFENDPLTGDTHGYTHIWYVPGNMYPTFLSENCRVSTPALRTMKVMMKPEDLWPEGYTGLQRKNSPYPWPEAWNQYNSNFGYVKLGEIERFYDGEDLESMLYRIGWGHGYYLRSRVERYRRGYPSELGPRKERITKGHLLWKFNNSSNHIFFGVIDYFGEPYIPYYSLKRAYAPLLLSFDVGNFIHLWMTNDTTKRVSGKVHVELFDPLVNQRVKSLEEPFQAEPDESKPLCNLNRFLQFKNNCILYAWAEDEKGQRLAETIDYCQLERQMRFPEDGTIQARIEGNELILTTDRYARSVELLGFDEDGDEFGWLFEDNYFDMIPGVEKRVKILRRKEKGKITVKGYYFTGMTEVAIG